MSKEVSKIKKFAVIGLKALGILALVWLAFQLAQGKFLQSGSVDETQTSYTSPSYGGSQDYYVSDSFAPAPAASMPRSLEESASPPVSEKSAGGKSQAIAPAPRKVVKDGSLSLLVKKAEATADKIKIIATELDGFVDEVDIKNVSETSKSGTVVIRVPADNFDEALVKIKELAVKVDKESANATDVTELFVDLEARLKNLKAQEAQYLKILDQAKKMEDILNVSSQLGYIRGEIERLEGKIKYLSSQVDMSSITVALTEEADVQLFGIRWRPLFVLKQAVRDMFAGLSGYADSMIAFIFLLPTLLLWLTTLVAGLWVARKIYRFVKHKFFSK